MSGRLLYLDSSALLKLVVPERETAALFSFLAEYPERVSSKLAVVEVGRAVRRAGAPAAVRRRASEVLARIALLEISDAVVSRAAELLPKDLRSLDAVHLATAMSLGDDLASLVAYDARLIEAARRARLPVVAPA